MPELPEVECVRRTLEPALAGRRPSRVAVGLAKMVRPEPKSFAAGIRGRLIKPLERHGKLLILPLEGGGYWTIHLGMTGQVILAPDRPQADHIHVTVSFDDGAEKLYFRDLRQFGAMTWCPDRAGLQAGPLKNMGPDALSISAGEFVDRMGGRTARIKPLLLDQRILAGVGNIYADECLHRAGINPSSRPADLKPGQLERLHAALIETLGEALIKGGSSVKNFVDARGRAGTFQHEHRVYRRTGQACPACGAAVERVVLGGRSTHFCPVCQVGCDQ